MSDILVLVESKSGKIKSSSYELLSEAGKLAASLGGSVKALLIGRDVKGIAESVGAYGASEAYVAEHADLSAYNVERYTAAIVAACKKVNPAVVMATASSIGRDVMPRVTARLDTGMMSECTELTVKEGKVVGTRPMYSGKCFVTVEIPSAMPQVITCRQNVFQTSTPEASKKASVVELEGDFASVATKATITEIREGKSDRPDLSEAQVIVSGGRSLKSAENFKILDELASVLGAAVGASRAAVDSGYALHDIQVGQTGKTVNPVLYIAAGISGAIQHLAGMRTSKVIVAINTDPEAPIFQVANYGIVGDLFTVVPLLTAECKKLLQN